ncbi:MAG: hypothetical protein AAGD88_08015 [Bacteroidota bacterium]
MKPITLLLLFCLTSNLRAQCDSISAEIWNIVKFEKYKAFDNLIMPMEQQKKILHWPESDETNDFLSILRDSLQKELVISAKKLRLELESKGFDLEGTKFLRCQSTGSQLEVFVANNAMESSFRVETRQTDKTYIVLPINERAPELPQVRLTKEELANATIVIAGEKFYRFEPSEFQKRKGLEILKKCINSTNVADEHILFRDAMKDKNGSSILTYLTVSPSNMNSYIVILENGTCENTSQ